ncbi:MAG TPA: hypothetical protein VIY52_24065 [Streptosporangiaceae bacterium]
MLILSAAVIVVGALCLTDLLLSFGIIRRLREHTTLLSGLRGAEVPVTGLSAGEVPDSFARVSTDGERLAGPAGLRMAAFFSSSCSACPERVPAFVDYLQANQIGRAGVLAVVLGPPGEPVPYLDRLAEVAQVCVEPDDSELAAAFKVIGYPAFCLLDADGAVLATGYDPAALPAPVAV